MPRQRLQVHGLALTGIRGSGQSAGEVANSRDRLMVEGEQFSECSKVQPAVPSPAFLHKAVVEVEPVDVEAQPFKVGRLRF